MTTMTVRLTQSAARSFATFLGNRLCCRWRGRCSNSRAAGQHVFPRKGPRRRRSRGSGHRRHPRRRDEDGGMARQARVDHPPLPEQLAGLKSQDALLADPNSKRPGFTPKYAETKAARASPRSSSASASVPPRLLAHRSLQTGGGGGMGANWQGGFLCRATAPRSTWPAASTEQARARQPRSSAVPVSERHPHHRGRRRRQQSLTPASRFHSR